MSRPLVFLVEDDLAVRESVVWMLDRQGIQVEAYETPEAFLNNYDSRKRGCLVLDLKLPGIGGVDLRKRLVAQGCDLPFIMMSGHGEIPDATNAMRMGAIDFIEKPLNRELFIDRVWQALDADVKQHREQEGQRRYQARLDALTRREREVLDLVVAGKLTKQIAKQLGVTIKTVEAHRSNITRKMQVDSVVQLVREVTEHAQAISELAEPSRDTD
jgi:two-component system, LuxR family, response regulator FixJ